jgi:molybdopterin converting factor small subunit
MVCVRLFAGAQQAAGAEIVHLPLALPATVGDLRRALVVQYPALARWEPYLLFAVDQRYARDEDRLAPQQEVACFPPVSGG